jgi:hypothetical protein
MKSNTIDYPFEADSWIADVQSMLELARVLITDAIIELQSHCKNFDDTLLFDRLGLNRERILCSFSYPEELSIILHLTEHTFDPLGRYPVNPFALILAIRESERGRSGLEFGVMHPEARETNLRTQAEWAIGTVKNNLERFENQTEEKDFIAFLGKRYAPVGAENDPENLNQNWIKNVRYWYDAFANSNK